MALVQTTLFPHPIDVPDDEIPILRAQGLLSEAARPPAEGERRYPITEVPDQKPGPGGGEPGIEVVAPPSADAGKKPDDTEETK